MIWSPAELQETSVAQLDQTIVIASSPLLVGGCLVIAVILVAAIAAVSLYNTLVRVRQTCMESWSDIDTELQRRHDLVPNLVSTVEGYAAHEKSVLEQVTRLRARAVDARKEDAETRAEIEEMLQGSIGTLIATAEAYPDLKANRSFLDLQQELADTETRVARSRRFYNDNVREFRAAALTFPSNLVAAGFGFRSSDFEFFEASPGDRDPVDTSGLG